MCAVEQYHQWKKHAPDSTLTIFGMQNPECDFISDRHMLKRGAQELLMAAVERGLVMVRQEFQVYLICFGSSAMNAGSVGCWWALY